MQNYLTTFDLQRAPRTKPLGFKPKLKFSLKSLNFHRCPICLSYMKKTYIVMECLHRFCGDCIQKCLRMGMKECPSCRVHIPSRRSLRPDKTYDKIMEAMYGDIEDLERREEKEVEDFNKKNNMNNSYSQSLRLKKIQQLNQRKKSGQVNVEKIIDSTGSHLHQTLEDKNNKSMNNNNEQTSIIVNNSATANISANYNKSRPQQIAKIHNIKQSSLIEFILRKDSRENSIPRLRREALKVSQDITMYHLKLFLTKKLSYDGSWKHFQITVGIGGRQVILDDSITLKQVRGEICDFTNGDMLMLQYFIQPIATSDVDCAMDS